MLDKKVVSYKRLLSKLYFNRKRYAEIAWRYFVLVFGGSDLSFS